MNRPKNWAAIAAFEAMTHEQKTRHWAIDKPWTFRGASVSLPAARDFNLNSVLMDLSGNITRMPELGGRPCFAQVTAFVRHGNWKYLVVRGRPTKTRCMRCSVREACKKVVDRRIRTSPAISKAYDEFMGAGGVNGLDHPREFARAPSKWSAFVQATVDHGGWDTSNDSYARSWVSHRIEEQRRKDRERKAQERRKQVRAGEPDPEFLAGMRANAIHRGWLLKQVIGRADTPRAIRQLPPESALLTAYVWMADRLLRIRGTRRNPSNIARLMIELGCHEGKSHNVLRQRVPADLRRIRLLEAAGRDGRPPIWPEFKLEDALPYEIDPLP